MREGGWGLNAGRGVGFDEEGGFVGREVVKGFWCKIRKN